MMVKTGNISISIRGADVPVISVLFLVVSIISLCVLKRAFQIKREREPKYIQVQHIRERSDLLVSYLIPYIFPFISLDYTLISSWLIFIIFIGSLAAIQLPSEQLYINPILALFGYKIFEVEDNRGETLLLLTKQSLKANGQGEKAVNLSGRVYLVI